MKQISAALFQAGTFSASSDTPFANAGSAARFARSHFFQAAFIGASPLIESQHHVRWPSLMREMSGRPGSSLYARPVYGFTCVSRLRENVFQFSNAGAWTPTRFL